MYESPINVYRSNVIEMKIENDIMSAIQKYDIDVDKDELIKALNYDRDQYNKGYQDGYQDAMDRFNNVLEAMRNNV